MLRNFLGRLEAPFLFISFNSYLYTMLSFCSLLDWSSSSLEFSLFNPTVLPFIHHNATVLSILRNPKAPKPAFKKSYYYQKVFSEVVFIILYSLFQIINPGYTDPFPYFTFEMHRIQSHCNLDFVRYFRIFAYVTIRNPLISLRSKRTEAW